MRDKELTAIILHFFNIVLVFCFVLSIFPRPRSLRSTTRGRPVIPTSRYSDVPIFRRPVIPTSRYSDVPLFRRTDIPTKVYPNSDNNVSIPTCRNIGLYRYSDNISKNCVGISEHFCRNNDIFLSEQRYTFVMHFYALQGPIVEKS